MDQSWPCFHLKKFLSDLLHVGRDDDEESGAEADEDVAVTEPVVRLDRPVTTLQSGQRLEFESRLDYFLS